MKYCVHNKECILSNLFLSNCVQPCPLSNILFFVIFVAVDFLKFKWRNLRDSFRRELKKVRSDAGPSSMNRPRSWPFFSNMLLEQMMPAITDSNLQRSPPSPSPHAQITLYPQSAYSSPSTSSSQGSEGGSVADHDSLCSHTSLDTSIGLEVDDTVCKILPASAPAAKRKRAASTFEKQMLSIESRKIQILENMLIYTFDPNMLFLKSIAPFMKDLSPARNMRLRLEMQACVMRAMEEE
ncbi:hypothetical protein FKM82_024753 [Ascaphus truei]